MLSLLVLFFQVLPRVVDVVLPKLREVSNFLGHRDAPGRKIYAQIGGSGPTRPRAADWNLPIEMVDPSTLLAPAELKRRRDWLGGQVAEISEAANRFGLTDIS